MHAHRKMDRHWVPHAPCSRLTCGAGGRAAALPHCAPEEPTFCSRASSQTPPIVGWERWRLQDRRCMRAPPCYRDIPEGTLKGVGPSTARQRAATRCAANGQPLLPKPHLPASPNSRLHWLALVREPSRLQMYASPSSSPNPSSSYSNSAVQAVQVVHRRRASAPPLGFVCSAAGTTNAVAGSARGSRRGPGGRCSARVPVRRQTPEAPCLT